MQLPQIKKISILQAIQDGLLRDKRSIAADWRILLILRRADREIPEEHRRWKRSWDMPWEARNWVLRNVPREILEPLEGCDSLFRLGKGVLSPDHPAASDLDVLMEAHPLAAISHISAMNFHGLSEDMPTQIHLSVPFSKFSHVIPFGTSDEDWVGLDTNIITYRRLDSISKKTVTWHRLRNNRYIGIKNYSRMGSNVRSMTPERVLIEGLISPELCGGLHSVIKAWKFAVDSMDLDHIFECANSIDSGVLKQRIGYLLNRLDIDDPILEEWANNAKHGGSSKFDPNAPFGHVSQYDEKWKISINTNATEELKK